MRIVGFIGSPRREGLTAQLVANALDGARAAGAEVEQVFLVDYQIQAWPRSMHDRYEALDQLAAEADGLVLGSPVYYKDVSGLMRDFIDYLHNAPAVSRVGGKPGFGLAVAGGSGMGQIPAINSLYGFFFFRGFRPLDPIPVSRFNLQAALAEARERGRELVAAAGHPQPFGNLAERVAHFDRLKYLNYNIADELFLVGEQLLSSTTAEEAIVARCRADLDRGRQLLAQGQREEAIAIGAGVYDTLFHR